MTDHPSPSTLAGMIRHSAPLLLRFLQGFDESNRTIQPPGLPNHPIWILGHTAFTMARFGHLIGNAAPSGADFISDATASASSSNREQRFLIDDIQKDSTPTDDPHRYPSLARGQEIFARAVEDLARAIESLPPARLQESVPWNDGPQRIDALAIRLCFHNGMHSGQLTDLRRVLGLSRVLPTSSSEAKSATPRQ